MDLRAHLTAAGLSPEIVDAVNEGFEEIGFDIDDVLSTPPKELLPLYKAANVPSRQRLALSNYLKSLQVKA